MELSVLPLDLILTVLECLWPREIWAYLKRNPGVAIVVGDRWMNAIGSRVLQRVECLEGAECAGYLTRALAGSAMALTGSSVLAAFDNDADVRWEARDVDVIGALTAENVGRVATWFECMRDKVRDVIKLDSLSQYMGLDPLAHGLPIDLTRRNPRGAALEYARKTLAPIDAFRHLRRRNVRAHYAPAMHGIRELVYFHHLPTVCYSVKLYMGTPIVRNIDFVFVPLPPSDNLKDSRRVLTEWVASSFDLNVCANLMWLSSKQGPGIIKLTAPEALFSRAATFSLRHYCARPTLLKNRYDEYGGRYGLRECNIDGLNADLKNNALDTSLLFSPTGIDITRPLECVLVATAHHFWSFGGHGARCVCSRRIAQRIFKYSRRGFNITVSSDLPPTISGNDWDGPAPIRPRAPKRHGKRLRKQYKDHANRSNQNTNHGAPKTPREASTRRPSPNPRPRKRLR